MKFRHERIDEEPPCSRQAICLPTDLTGNGLPDVIVAGNKPEPRVYWYENPGWKRHEIANGTPICPGAVLGDLTGNGRLDLIGGGPWGSKETFWFEQPADPTDPWEKHGICNDFHKYHDQEFADVDDDSEPEVLLVSQNAEVICYYDIPDDPRGDGWSRKNRTFIDAGVGDAEGIQVTDIDGDGKTEVIVGRRIYSRRDAAGDEWTAQRVAPDWVDERVRVVTADIDEDGHTEIILAECELPPLGERHGLFDDARLGVCSAPDWKPEVLMDDLWCPHTLQVGDLDDDGHPEIYVAESDFRGNETPKHFVLSYDDDFWDRELIHEGTAIHQGKVVDMDGDGRLDIVGKDDTDPPHVDIWYNES